MPAKNQNEANYNFAHYFRESLSAVTKEYLQGSVDGDTRILLYEPPVKLRRGEGNSLYFSVTQTYKVVENPEGYKARTTSYSYSLFVKVGHEELRPILEFHWHPGSEVDWPHVHVISDCADGSLDRKHFPTARLAIEDFLRFIIRDFGVKEIISHQKAKKILTKNKSEFVKGASWLYYEPLI